MTEEIDTQPPAPERVLIVEDDEPSRQLLRRILDRDGWETVEAENAREGLEKIALRPPSLILLDLMMPDMDGWEVYQQMKADSELKNIPVIVVTAKAQSIDKILGLHIAKVDDYVTKPFGPQELLQSVERVLQTKATA